MTNSGMNCLIVRTNASPRYYRTRRPTLASRPRCKCSMGTSKKSYVIPCIGHCSQMLSDSVALSMFLILEISCLISVLHHNQQYFSYRVNCLIHVCCLQKYLLKLIYRLQNVFISCALCVKCSP